MDPMLMTRDGVVRRGPGLEQREEELGGVEDALDVEVEDPVPRGGVVLGQRRPPGGPGVVDQYVDGGMAGADLVCESSGPLLGGQVGGHSRAGAVAGELGHRRVDGVGLAGRDDDGGPGGHEPARDHPADPPGAAGDHHRLARNREELVRGGGSRVSGGRGCEWVTHNGDGSATRRGGAERGRRGEGCRPAPCLAGDLDPAERPCTRCVSTGRRPIVRVPGGQEGEGCIWH